MGLALAILASTGAAMTVGLFTVYLRHWDTPIVKTAGGFIFYCSAGGLLSSFLSTFLYIGRPTEWKCRARLPLFALSFCLFFTSILAKTARILCAFASPAGRPTKLQTRLHLIILLLGNSAQLLICLLWLLFSPPYSRYVFPKVEAQILIECYHPSRVPTYFVIGHLCFLALCTLLGAIKGHSLPSNFNDSQGISFSTMAFYAIWSSAIPVLEPSEGETAATVTACAILLSAYSSLVFLFLRKSYTILVKPERNTPEWVKKSNFEYCQKLAQKANLSIQLDSSSSLGTSDTMAMHSVSDR
ncbi:UNVERIFIED_CONTAM: hypothetical protein FKN15_040934 [Acipenser sinensis]